jgi:uncharacterized protein YgbK (DUF1537 family)
LSFPQGICICRSATDLHPLLLMLYTYYGDDFTGSTDVLEQLGANGIPAVLFIGAPSSAHLAAFPTAQALGIAGDARSRSPQWMSNHLPAIFRTLQQFRAPITHYKVCSTFDSSPTTGSIGRAIEIGREIFQPRFIPIVVGAPHLRRYVAFGNLFAAAPDGTIQRIDRHPMSRHPVTPMHEADLRLHLAAQTNLPIGLIDVPTLKAHVPHSSQSHRDEWEEQSSASTPTPKLSMPHSSQSHRDEWEEQSSAGTPAPKLSMPHSSQPHHDEWDEQSSPSSAAHTLPVPHSSQSHRDEWEEQSSAGTPAPKLSMPHSSQPHRDPGSPASDVGSLGWGEWDVQSQASGIASLARNAWEAKYLDPLIATHPAILFDTIDESTQSIVGGLLWTRARQQPLFAAGSSGLTAALVSVWNRAGLTTPQFSATLQPACPLLVLSGSCSTVTERQLRYALAHGYHGIAIDPAALLDATGSTLAQILEAATQSLSAGRDTILYTTLGTPSTPAHGDLLGIALGSLLRELVTRAARFPAPVRRVLICGGDTASHAVQQLGIYALTWVANIQPGGPLCHAHADGPLDGLELVLKGGQVGTPDFFDKVRGI